MSDNFFAKLRSNQNTILSTYLVKSSLVSYSKFHQLHPSKRVTTLIRVSMQFLVRMGSQLASWCRSSFHLKLQLQVKYCPSTSCCRFRRIHFTSLCCVKTVTIPFPDGDWTFQSAHSKPHGRMVPTTNTTFRIYSTCLLVVFKSRHLSFAVKLREMSGTKPSVRQPPTVYIVMDYVSFIEDRRDGMETSRTRTSTRQNNTDTHAPMIEADPVTSTLRERVLRTVL